MSLNFLNCSFGNKPAVRALPNMSDNTQDIINKIYSALKEIKGNDVLTADIGTISRLCGITPDETYKCLSDSDNCDLYDFWQSVLRKDSKEPPKQSREVQISLPISYLKEYPAVLKNNICITKVSNPEQPSSDDIEKVEQAIRQVLSNSKLDATIENLVEISGLPVKTVLHSIHTPGKDIYNLWQYTLSVKDDDNPARRCRLMKFYKVYDESVFEVKRKNPALALSLLKEAAANRSQISYQSIEKVSGLNKNEIDELIYSYAKSRQEQVRLRQTNKALQAKWYEEYRSSSKIG